MPIKDIYVLDIYQLASQLFSHEDVKSMNISEILRKVKHKIASALQFNRKDDDQHFCLVCLFLHS